MNEYIFYTTEGYTLPPKENEEVENCQVLGRASGNNAKEAQLELEKENPWIKECGFNIENSICKQILTEETKRDIKAIVQYSLEEEYRHFLECEEPENHIYHTLKRLQDAIA
ncbi:MAG: hypothetical protein IKH61_11035 [Bacteroidales bacterium]|nr:hypothetical protein [Bacteroidales bacterium]